MASLDNLLAPVSVGELADKITILQIKAAEISDAQKLENVRTELAVLKAVFDPIAAGAPAGLDGLLSRLGEINRTLWDIEDDIRLKEREGDFGAEFIRLARAVYHTNDERSRVKKEMNLLLGSALVEEKSYSDYSNPAAA